MKNIEIIAIEIQTAKEKYGQFHSTHGVYGVLIEEIQEFFDVVKEKPIHQNEFMASEKTESKTNRMIHELNQIAAIALRAADELKNNEIKWI
jgi:hypothetical protein